MNFADNSDADSNQIHLSEGSLHVWYHALPPFSCSYFGFLI